jgi:hypothetical protein
MRLLPLRIDLGRQLELGPESTGMRLARRVEPLGQEEMGSRRQLGALCFGALAG